MLDFEVSFPRYLSAKKSVDDRALNRHVWQELALHLSRVKSDLPLRVLEVGAGIGTMLERMVDWDLLTQADYTALDAQVENIAVARQRLPLWAQARGDAFRMSADGISAAVYNPGLDLTVRWTAAEVLDFAAHARGQQWDLLVAHAFLDLLDLPRALPVLLRLVRPGGLCYFSLNFDGATLFEPAWDLQLEEQIQALYHRTMDERQVGGKPSGDSRSGRHLFGLLRANSAEILASGASDWVVFAGAQGYVEDEAYFLQFILHTVHQALHGQPGLERGLLDSWLEKRLQQVESRELVYIAHQLDFLARV